MVRSVAGTAPREEPWLSRVLDRCGSGLLYAVGHLALCAGATAHVDGRGGVCSDGSGRVRGHVAPWGRLRAAGPSHAVVRPGGLDWHPADGRRRTGHSDRSRLATPYPTAGCGCQSGAVGCHPGGRAPIMGLPRTLIAGAAMALTVGVGLRKRRWVMVAMSRAVRPVTPGRAPA
jgi:hypothetical protein